MINEGNYTQMSELLTTVLLENRELKNEIAALKNDKGYAELNAQVNEMTASILELGERIAKTDVNFKNLCDVTLPPYIQKQIDSNKSSLLGNLTGSNKVELPKDGGLFPADPK